MLVVINVEKYKAAIHLDAMDLKVLWCKVMLTNIALLSHLVYLTSLNKWNGSLACIVECWNKGNRGENYIMEYSAKRNRAETVISLFKINEEI